MGRRRGARQVRRISDCAHYCMSRGKKVRQSDLDKLDAERRSLRALRNAVNKCVTVDSGVLELVAQ